MTFLGLYVAFLLGCTSPHASTAYAQVQILRVLRPRWSARPDVGPRV